jgi:hypothetical protein
MKSLLQRPRGLPGSSPFEVSIADLAASASMMYGMEHRTDVMGFLPMNYLRIMNKGGTTLKIYVNDSTNGEVIPDSTAWEWKGAALWNFTLTNLSTQNTAIGALVYTTVQQKPTGV